MKLGIFILIVALGVIILGIYGIVSGEAVTGIVIKMMAGLIIGIPWGVNRIRKDMAKENDDGNC
jgi:hypothetical protein